MPISLDNYREYKQLISNEKAALTHDFAATMAHAHMPGLEGSAIRMMDELKKSLINKKELRTHNNYAALICLMEDFGDPGENLDYCRDLLSQDPKSEHNFYFYIYILGNSNLTHKELLEERKEIEPLINKDSRLKGVFLELLYEATKQKNNIHQFPQTPPDLD